MRNMEADAHRANDYLILGDFNFPFLNFKDNDVSVINDQALKKTCLSCSDVKNCNHTSSERRQAQHLLDFSNEFFLQQYIHKPTRRQNILDLVFTNNHFLINNYHMIVNSHLSDHYTIILNLNYENIKVEGNRKKVNHFHTEIPEFNFLEADEEDWMRLNRELDQVDWCSILEEESPENMTSLFLSKLLEKVQLIFKKLPQFDENSKEDGNKRFSSNNKIPRKIRVLMRNKSKLSKSLLSVKSPTRYLELSDKLEYLEKQLKDSYEERRRNQ